jgi:hypothetical protein
MRRLVVVAVAALAIAGCGLLRKAKDASLDVDATANVDATAEVDATAQAEAAPKASGALATKGAPVAASPAPTAPAAAAAAPIAPAPAGTPPPPVTIVPSTSGMAAPAAGLDTKAIEEATGLTGAMMPDGAFRITKPRGDLKVALDGFSITPRMGLAGWFGFRDHASGALLRGVMPVASDELQPVVTALANAGLESTGIHAHFVGEDPRITFVHFVGVGNELALARGVRDVLDAIVRARALRPTKGSAGDARSDLDVARLDATLGTHGEHDGQVYRASIPRPDFRVTDLGLDLGATMSPTSWAAFQGTDERAAVAGELMLRPAEVPPVIHALRESRIGVVGIHEESGRAEPRVTFVSFWGVGRLESLAAGVRKALDQLPRGG